MVAGKILYEDGEFSIGEEPDFVYRKAEEITGRILEIDRKREHMKFVIQRVSHAKVDADHKTVGSIDRGFLVLIGVGQNDTRETADKLIKKMVGLRILMMKTERRILH